VIDKNDKRLTFMPEDKVTATKGHCFAYHNYWWCICPERGLMFFNKHPQANMNQQIGVDLMMRLYPWAELKQFPLVLVRDNI